MQQVKTLTKHNFNAGPSILPKQVFEQAAQAVMEFNNTGLSILEIGHRTELFQQVLDEAVALVKELMDLSDEQQVLFLHGGASTQFFQVPMNLLKEDETASYLDCGVWGKKAIKEANVFGKVNVVASSKDKGYTYIPKNFDIPSDSKYFHYTTNNTIEGTQMHFVPGTNVPIVADMSSDILSRVLDFNKFDLIYAGAQKNIGPSGVTPSAGPSASSCGPFCRPKHRASTPARILPNSAGGQERCRSRGWFGLPAHTRPIRGRPASPPRAAASSGAMPRGAWR